MAKLKTSEYQLESALNDYTADNEIIAINSCYSALSLKYVWDLFSIASYRFSKFASTARIHKKAWVHPTAIITGEVVVEEGAKIFEYALLQGPCYIGKNCIVGSYCKVRKESILEEEVELQNNVEVKHSIIQTNTHIHSGFIGDSIIGKDCRIGAGFITANRRLDRKNVKVPIKDSIVDVGSSSFGTLIGDRTRIGIHCGTNPGVIIPEDSFIMPMTMVYKKTSNRKL